MEELTCSARASCEHLTCAKESHVQTPDTLLHPSTRTPQSTKLTHLCLSLQVTRTLFVCEMTGQRSPLTGGSVYITTSPRSPDRNGARCVTRVTARCSVRGSRVEVGTAPFHLAPTAAINLRYKSMSPWTLVRAKHLTEHFNIVLLQLLYCRKLL